MSLFLQPLLDTHDELIVDGFAGGGGASSGIEQALGRPVDVAMNHDAAAIAMHAVNHPQTLHLQTDIYEVDPRRATGGRPVGFAWFSPDCTFYSKARGGKPIRHATKKRRALAWVIPYWGGTAKPRVMVLENVEEFFGWGPLRAKKEKGRIARTDGTHADRRERVPVHEQQLVPHPGRKGRTFRKWVKALQGLGYAVEWRELRACDFGAPTIRKRLYVIARRDGRPIVWPEPTHGDPEGEGVRSGRLKPWRTAAECIDWSIPMCSIFATKEEARAWGKEHGQASPIRPLAENTDRRIARGVMRYVVNNPKPFLVNVAHSETSKSGAKRRGKGEHPLDAPTKTIAVSKDLALVSPVIAGVGGRAGQSPERPGDAPMQTVTAKADSVVVAPVMLRNQTSERSKVADDPTAPLGTILACGANHAVVAPLLSPITHQGDRNTPPPDAPLPTITCANRGELSVVAPCLVPRYGEREGQEPRSRSVEKPLPTVVNDANGAAVVSAHLAAFRNGDGSDERSVAVDRPLGTQDTSNRFGVISAHLAAYHHGEGSADRNVPLDRPLQTQDTANRFGVVAASLVQNNEGHYTGDGRALDAPAPTVCATGSSQSLLGISLVVQHGTGEGADPAAPLGTVLSGGTHHGLAAAHIQRDFGQSVGSALDAPIGALTGGGSGKAALVGTMVEARAKGYDGPLGNWAKVARFLQTYRPDGAPEIDISRPVDVRVRTETYYIADIAMRMLQPKELYAAQGFRPGYVFDRGADGKPLTKTEQVRMCGNSVSPPVAEALVRANVPEMIARPVAKARKVRSKVTA